MRNRAFTLLEILITLIISGIIMGVSYAVLLRAWLDFEVNAARTELQDQVFRAQRTLEIDALMANRIEPQDFKKSVVLSYPSGIVNNNSGAQFNGYIGYATGITPFPQSTITYSIRGGDLIKITGADLPENVTTGGFITDKSVFDSNDKNLHVTLHFLTTQAFGTKVTQDLDVTYEMRNGN